MQGAVLNYPGSEVLNPNPGVKTQEKLPQNKTGKRTAHVA